MKPLIVVLAAALLVVLAVDCSRVRCSHQEAARTTGGVPAAVSVVVPVAGARVRVADLRVLSRRPHPRVRHARPDLDWDALAGCESSQHWDDNTGNGYYGGLQMDPAFWRTYGGLRFASRPDLASRRQQIIVGLRGWRVRGSDPWPNCGYLLGGAR